MIDSLKVNEIFLSIDGEVNHMGQGCFSTFIRLSGCNCKCSYCFGIKPFRHIPRIILSSGINKKINEVCIGDKLLTYDNNLNLVETEVKQVFKHEVNEWYEIKINKKLYFVTPEHPFFTNKGIIKTKDLKIGDQILHSNFKDKLSFRMLKNNPMKNPLIVEKSVKNTNYQIISSKMKERIKKEKENKIYISPWNRLSEEQKNELRNSLSKKMMKNGNPNWKGGKNYNYHYLTSLCVKGVLTKCGLCKKENLKLEVHHIDENKNNDQLNNLITICHSCHSKIHKKGYNFWKSQRKDNKQLKNLSVYNDYKFLISNGFTVEYIRKINRKMFPLSLRQKPLQVYNFSCFPYNTYFVDYMWVHNCDTPHHLNSITLTIPEIIKKVNEIGCNKITITGGEPLLQPAVIPLIEALVYSHHYVSVETNGSIDIPFIMGSFYLSFVVDYKLPSSGMMNKMRPITMFKKLSPNDFIKFVIQDNEDFIYAVEITKEIRSLNAGVSIAFSPVFTQKDDGSFISTYPLYDKMIEANLFKIPKIYLNYQIHKLLKVK